MITSTLCRQLCSLGVPKLQRNQLISEIQRWVDGSGEEWTVERLKSLKLEFITRLTGEPVLAPYVRRNRNGLPKGVWSWLFTTKQLDPERKLNVLMVYSAFKARTMTVKQQKKFFGSMESADRTGLTSTFKIVHPLHIRGPIGPWRVTDSPSDCSLRGKVFEGAGRPFMAYYDEYESSKSSPNLFGRSLTKSDAFSHWLSFIVNWNGIYAYREWPMLFQTGTFPNIPVYWVNWLKDRSEMPSDFQIFSTCVGKIAPIQEPGYKLRAVASPLLIWQEMLRPLKEVIYRDLRDNHPGDCTHDQDLGVERVRGWLQSGKVCYSVDMSDATNLMPINLQVDLLHKRYVCEAPAMQEYMDQMIQCFQYVSQGDWAFEDPRTHEVTKHRFTRGQPLGLLPSFGSFALAHNTLLEGICEKQGIAPNCFVICGDDIVISDPRVYKAYRASLDNLGCKVSESKTLSSDKVAEFAGKVILADKILTPYKWKGISDSNFLALAKEYGPRVRTFLRKDERRLLDAIAPLPEYLGGFGWNPKGIPLKDRINTPFARALSDALFVDESQQMEIYESLGGRVRAFNEDWLHASLNEDFLVERVKECFTICEDPFNDFSRKLYSVEGNAEGTTSTLIGEIWSGPVAYTAEKAMPSPDRVILLCSDTYWQSDVTKDIYVRREPKVIYSPSRRVASNFLEATYKLEAAGADPSYWKDLRREMERATRRSTKTKTSTSLKGADDVRPSIPEPDDSHRQGRHGIGR